MAMDELPTAMSQLNRIGFHPLLEVAPGCRHRQPNNSPPRRSARSSSPRSASRWGQPWKPKCGQALAPKHSGEIGGLSVIWTTAADYIQFYRLLTVAQSEAN
jgi:hypothetical protein